MTLLGIDSGAQSAIDVLDETGQLLAVEDMPSLFEANGRTATSAPLLAGVLALRGPPSAAEGSSSLSYTKGADGPPVSADFSAGHPSPSMLRNGKENGKSNLRAGKPRGDLPSGRLELLRRCQDATRRQTIDKL
jgi:hypothetical protein